MSRPRTLGALLLAAASVFGAGAVVQTAPASSSVQGSQKGDDKSTTPAPQVAQAPVFIPRGIAQYGRTVHPIWVGVKKRGNRLHRSRFNYNR